MFNGSMPSNESPNFKPIGTSGSQEQEKKPFEGQTAAFFRKEGLKMPDNTNIEWLDPLADVIKSEVSKLMWAVGVATTVLVAVPLWLYDEGKGSIEKLNAALTSSEAKLERQISEDFQALDTKINYTADKLDRRIEATQELVIDNGKAISEVKGSLESVIILLEEK